MCRNIIAFFVGILIIMLLSLELFLGVIFIRANSPELYKKVLDENNVYSKVEGQFQDLLLQNITIQGADLINSNQIENIEPDARISPVYDDFYETLSNESKDLFKNIINAEKIKIFFENNITIIIAFFNSSDNDLVLFFPETEIVNTIKEDIGGLLNKGTSLFEKAKNCSSSDEVKFYQDINLRNRTELKCLPSNLKSQTVASLNKLVNDFNKNFLSENSKNNPVLDGDNKISYRELLAFNKANPNETMQNFKNIQQGLLLTKIALIVNLIFIIVLSVIFILLFKANLFRRLWLFGIFVFISGFLVIVMNIASNVFTISTVEANAKQYLGPVIANDYSDLLTTFIRSLFDYGRNVSLIFTLITFLFVVVFFALDKFTKKIRSQASPEATLASDE